MEQREPSMCVLPPKLRRQVAATVVASREDEVQVEEEDEDEDEEKGVLATAVVAAVKGQGALEAAGRGPKLV